MPVYTFRTNKGDEDVDEILSRIPVSARGWFFKEAVRFHAGLSDELKTLNQNMQRLMGGAAVSSPPVMKEESTQDDMEDMLAMGIADLLK